MRNRYEREKTTRKLFFLLLPLSLSVTEPYECNDVYAMCFSNRHFFVNNQLHKNDISVNTHFAYATLQLSQNIEARYS